MTKQQQLSDKLVGCKVVDVAVGTSHGEVIRLKLKNEDDRIIEVHFCTYEGTPWEKTHSVPHDVCVTVNDKHIESD